MLSLQEAKRIIQSHLPGSKILRMARCKNKYVAVVDTKVAGEALFDPFYLVNIDTGAFSGISVLTEEYFRALFAEVDHK